MAAGADPVRTGLVASLARPGGNITGMSGIAPELEGKRLELLRAILPGLSRVAYLAYGSDPAHRLFVKEAQDALRDSAYRCSHWCSAVSRRWTGPLQPCVVSRRRR